MCLIVKKKKNKSSFPIFKKGVYTPIDSLKLKTKQWDEVTQTSPGPPRRSEGSANIWGRNVPVFGSRILPSLPFYRTRSPSARRLRGTATKPVTTCRYKIKFTCLHWSRRGWRASKELGAPGRMDHWDLPEIPPEDPEDSACSTILGRMLFLLHLDRRRTHIGDAGVGTPSRSLVQLQYLDLSFFGRLWFRCGGVVYVGTSSVLGGCGRRNRRDV